MQKGRRERGRKWEKREWEKGKKFALKMSDVEVGEQSCRNGGGEDRLEKCFCYKDFIRVSITLLQWGWRDGEVTAVLSSCLQFSLHREKLKGSLRS